MQSTIPQIDVESFCNAHLPDVKSGSDSIFFQVNDDWGLKFFHTEKQRDANYCLLRRLANKGLSPTTCKKVDVQIESQTVYGFWTMICEVLGDLPMTFDEIFGVIRKFKKDNNDVFWSDLHSGNVGVLGRTIVAFDVSRMVSDVTLTEQIMKSKHEKFSFI